VQRFSEIAGPLHGLTEKQVEFRWTEDCENTLTSSKERLTSAPSLEWPWEDFSFVLDTDASNAGTGAVFSQTQDGEEGVIGGQEQADPSSPRPASRCDGTVHRM